jgi:hypothetical protein
MNGYQPVGLAAGMNGRACEDGKGEEKAKDIG